MGPKNRRGDSSRTPRVPGARPEKRRGRYGAPLRVRSRRRIQMICLDACIIGHVIAPENSRVGTAEIAASCGLVDKIITEQIQGCSPTIMISETKWLIARYAKETAPTEIL